MQTIQYDDFLQLEKERCSDGSVCLVVHLAVTVLKIGDEIPPVFLFYLFKPVQLWFA